MEPFTIQVTERESVSALLYAAPKAKRAGITLVLGHGAGGNQLSGFMRLFASGLADRGLDSVTFNFLYSEQGRSGPDPKLRLESCYQAVIDAVVRHRKLSGNRLVIGGKSMGGRIASQVAAAWSEKAEVKHEETRTKKTAKDKVETRTPPDFAGLVFLGYPLHPPGKPEQLRDKHLKDVHAPMLFVQGTRDAFGTPDELKAIIKRLKPAATLYLIDGGDHSFKVPKSIGISQEQVYESTMDEIARWSGAN
ncbi:MAG TPA: alpha/beta family hydrolase [Pyrinomonadaceae bacterium]|nr:alpha/beta family hydrolase [Pyrinomonadaceae bacterium]